MEKFRWAQIWKDQYNSEIRKRNTKKSARDAKDHILDQIYFPEINRMKVFEGSIFAMLAYRFPLNPVISRIIQRFISDEHLKELILSPRYLHDNKKTYPRYYSERERIVVIMNRFCVSGNINEFISWIQFQTDKSTFHYIHLMIGVNFLDHYLDRPFRRDESLDISIRYLEKASLNFSSEESKLTINSLLAFGHYMNRDFVKSAGYLKIKNSEFEVGFMELINKVA